MVFINVVEVHDRTLIEVLNNCLQMMGTLKVNFKTRMFDAAMTCVLALGDSKYFYMDIDYKGDLLWVHFLSHLLWMSS